MQVFKQKLLLITVFLMTGFFFKLLKDLKSKLFLFKSFFIVLLFYSPFLFSDSYGVQNQSKELIVKADKLCRAKNRLISMSQVVYQSVKAPQKERLDEEGRRPFDDYDLIRGKPAGVIVRIRKRYRVRKEGLQGTSLDFNAEELIKKFDFSLSLKINGKLYNETLCSKELKEEAVNYKVDLSNKKDPEEVIFTAEKANCVFNWADLKDESIYKFISLPTKLGEPLGENLGPAEVEILSQLKPKDSIDDVFVKACESSRDFKANMLDSRSFKILFTGIEGPYCGDKDKNGNPKKAYRTTIYSDIRDYLNSTVVRKDFYDMFPVSNRRPYKPEIGLLQENNQRKFYIETFYEDRRVEREEADAFPLFADFSLSCDSFFDKGYTISVKESYREDGRQKENILIDSQPVKWEHKL
ncbi:MAG: hypothetical protein OXJ52_02730 [Oligoflexia bacterium]|nr:hypothetical protein [Oligoflexia bacterium]